MIELISHSKPVHVKPSLYAVYYEILKEVAKNYGYNLVLHGSLNRDMDLIAIPWAEEVKPHYPMIEEFAEILGGKIMVDDENRRKYLEKLFHGRLQYVININRDLVMTYEGLGITEIKHHQNAQYYLDISITPMVNVE